MSDVNLVENGGIDHRTFVGSAAYTFYLNLVVIEHVPGHLDKVEEKEETSTDLDKKKHTMGFNLDKSLHNFSRAMSKKSQAMSQKAAAYVASKTMVGRASAALSKSLGELSSQNFEIIMGKRFQQGPVIVVHVHLKASDLPGYIAEVRGEDAAEKYRTAMMSLHALGALETMGSLEKEMLPQIRQALMERMAEKLVHCMKEKDATLALECIPLDESEEAHWLFTFMEFQAQMKKESKN